MDELRSGARTHRGITFLMVDVWQVPHYYTLQAGEYIQGLVAHVLKHRRLYVVTVPTPEQHADKFREPPSWPRVVSARRPR
jgi:hypothetical protein